MNETRTSSPSWLSTAGILANGGLRPPGTEGMKSQTGSSKPKSKPVVKATTKGNWDHTKTKDENLGIDSSKPITKGRVVTQGLYKFGETQARVRVSQAGRPYALVYNNGSWEYTPGALRLLKASDRIEEQEPRVAALKPYPGFYAFGAGVAEVVKTKDGQRTYAKVLDVHTGHWAYVAGAVSKIKPEDRLTLDQAAALGKKWHRCMCCGAELTAEESIERGIGPVCAGKL